MAYGGIAIRDETYTRVCSICVWAFLYTSFSTRSKCLAICLKEVNSPSHEEDEASSYLTFVVGRSGAGMMEEWGGWTIGDSK